MVVSPLDHARNLVSRLANQCSSQNDFGSMSSSIYDTAWLAMVQKDNEKEVKWLFPECFEYILAHQLPSGGWESYATPVDGVLNTAAALLALKKHQKMCPENIDLLERGIKAEKALSEMLDSVNVETADQVGFEILVVQHIALLQDEGVPLEARKLEGLRKIQREKLAKLPPQSVYNAPSTLYHSLEALIGHIDFDQVSRWREPNGSMMGSPSSTAAYLIYATSWDEAAETYLKNVLKHGSGKAPGSLPDADDTAKAVIALCDLGYSPSVDNLLEAFESTDHFITYPNERNPSFTTNCHVLISLLKISDSSHYISQIQKATVYLTSRAFAGDWRDKWNRSEYYTMMLLMKAYELLYRQPDLVKQLFKSSPNLENQIPIIALDCLRRLLLQQGSSGAWGGDVNYAYDTLSEAYCHAAALISVDPAPSSNFHTTNDAFLLPKDILGQIKKAGYLIFRTPLMVNVSKAVQSVAELQAGFYFCLLQQNPVSIFPPAPDQKASYQVIIPLAFTACTVTNNHTSLNLQLLREMMILSNLNFLVDEYMECAIDKYLNNYREQSPLSDIATTITQYVEYILNHAAVLASPECYQDRLAFELKACLSAHVTQAEDNYNYMRQHAPLTNGATTNGTTDHDISAGVKSHNGAPQTRQYTKPGRTFYNWVRSTSADHTSCPFSFVFFNSLLYSTTINHKQNLFGKSRTAYVAEDLCRHLASLCRMYNDYGSLQRDAKENNLNSINFLEFAPLPSSGTQRDDVSWAKSELLCVAEYERRGVETSLDVLGKEFAHDNQRHVVDALRFFINVTDLFGQVYVLKDRRRGASSPIPASVAKLSKYPMAFDSSLSATLSPTTSEAFGSHVLSSSISSLVSSTSPRVVPSQISKTYRQASQLFLTRRLPEALSTLLPLITPSTEGSDVNGLTEPAPVVRASRATRIKVWSLYLTILNAILELDSEEGKEAFGSQEWRALCQKVRNGDVWEEVVQFGYHGIEGDVDSDVVINLATLLLSHARSQVVNQKRLENYLAASNTPNLDISRQLEAARSHRPSSRSGRSKSKGAASGADTPRDLNARVKILELYTLHVLLRNNEWDYAREFISVSSVLDEERREAFLQALQSLQEEQQAAQQREREEQQKQEEELRRDIEHARRLRAENEAKERRQLEEEHAKREASEVDYGIEQSPQALSSSKARSPRNGSALSKSSQESSSTSKAKKAVATPGLGTRAAMIIANLRNVIEHIIVMFSRKDLRERVQRLLGTGWNKVKQTAGMGVKYIQLSGQVRVFAFVLAPDAMSAKEGLSNHHDANAKMAEPEPEPAREQSQDPTTADARQKRKASSPVAPEDPTPQSVKRSKVDGENINKRHESSPQSTTEAGTDRREMARQEEKKRGRRLLGGLMNTLSQANAGSQHRKRQEIERRQQAKSTQQRVEEDRLRMQRLSKLEAVRNVEQLKFDEQVMKTKHADMLAKARYLQTEAKPRIFYRPYQPTRKQKDTIQVQIERTQGIIKKEVSEFRERRERRLQELGIASKPSTSGKDETVGKPNDEPPADKSQPESTNRPSSRITNKVGPDKDSDRADDVMIEEDEDTVIY
ncbi:hypothetical protein NUW58_g1887 [Xylaria curta]|uniref:Uncharacterized protein n=1 Tax=Xylaria curta TaxID=42375 RepID=A0ACC1PI79_9PEZI|nr:hypothetical protein NUW58_g1887 [Xylaria curta]